MTDNVADLDKVGVGVTDHEVVSDSVNELVGVGVGGGVIETDIDVPLDRVTETESVVWVLADNERDPERVRDSEDVESADAVPLVVLDAVTDRDPTEVEELRDELMYLVGWLRDQEIVSDLPMDVELVLYGLDVAGNVAVNKCIKVFV